MKFWPIVLWLDWVSDHDLLVAVLDEDITVFFPKPWTLLLIKLC
jgi:hypothetical protein